MSPYSRGASPLNHHLARSQVLIDLAAALIGGLVFVVLHGWRVLDPTFVGWLLYEDRAMNLAGWLFARPAPWSWPLGAAPGLLVPIGGSVALADSVPLVAIVAKVFSPVLPDPFQYFGLFWLASYVLLAVASVRLLRRWTADPVVLLGVAALVTAGPLMAGRGQHLALCAQWLLVAAIALALGRPRPWLLVALAMVAASIHAYLGLMVTLIAAVTLLRLASKRAATGWLLALVAGVLAVFISFGFAVGLRGDVYGFGDFSLDLLAPFNSFGRSLLVSPLPAGPGQYEGYAYLGLGIWLLIIAAGFALWRGARLAIPRPIIMLALVLAVAALSTRITVGGATLLDLRFLDPLLGPLPGAIRASGRLVWPALYLLIFVAAGLVARAFPGPVARALVLIALLVQTVEFQPLYRQASATVADRYDLVSPLWSTLGDSYRHLVLLPPDIHPYACHDADTDPYEVSRWTTLAGLEGITINSGNLTRMDPAAAAAACAAGDDLLASGALPPDTVAILRRGTLDAFERAGAGRIACGLIDRHAVCVLAGTPSAVRDALRED